jgi:hypothetical protein
MARIVVGLPNLTQPLLLYLGLRPAMLEQHRRSCCAFGYLQKRKKDCIFCGGSNNQCVKKLVIFLEARSGVIEMLAEIVTPSSSREPIEIYHETNQQFMYSTSLESYLACIHVPCHIKTII